MKKILSVLTLSLTLSVSAQYEPVDTFDDICPTAVVPKIEQLNPVVGDSVYFWTQYVDTRGDLVFVSFNIQMVEVGRKSFRGDWC